VERRDTNLATDLEASRERLATCCQLPGNREGPTFLAVSIGRRESWSMIFKATAQRIAENIAKLPDLLRQQRLAVA